MFNVYLLKSEIDGKYYIGQAEDLTERLKRHNSGWINATKYRRPLRFLGHESFNLRNEAGFREYELKHNTNERKKFYQKLDKSS